MKQVISRTFGAKGGMVNHKRSFLFVALTVALVFAFAASAYAYLAPTRARTFNWMTDYYTWGTPVGGGVFVDSVTTPRIQDLGANPANPGVHAGYLANTAKCGICHSVHRARGDGVKLLNAQFGVCAGCHMTGSTVTNVVINWASGGPHSSGNPALCLNRACHMANPHGAGGSQYTIVAEKLLNPYTDSMFTTALANPTSSGITVAALDGTVWPDSTESLVRTGYNCNICHASTMLAVVGSWTAAGETRWWAEDRHRNATDHAPVSKTGHPGIGSTAATSRAGVPIAWAPVTDFESCHDQTDAATRSGFTFPHSQTPVGASNMGTGRAFLWMGWSGGAGQPLTAIADGNQKAYDGNCLKCHRNNAGDAGVGVTY